MCQGPLTADPIAPRWGLEVILEYSFEIEIAIRMN